MSQRLFSTLFAFVIFILVGLLAASQHVLPPLTDLQNNFFTLVTPAFGVLFTINAWLDVVDAKVADGSLTPGEVGALLTLPEFWTAMVTVGVGAAQTVGLKVLDQNSQVLLVNALLAFSNIVLRSFVNRTPGQDLTVSQFVKGNRVEKAA